LYETRQKKNIPHYSLQRTAEEGSDLFQIKEVEGGSTPRPEYLFLPHRKDYYFFFLVKKGNNHHWIDFIRHEVSPGNIYFTVPHQVHLKEKEAALDGVLLAFTDEFILLHEQRSWKKLPILRNPDDLHELRPTQQEFNFINTLLIQMLAEYSQQQDWKKGVLQSYLKIFLVCLSRIYTRQSNTHPPPSNSRWLVKRFTELVNEKYESLHQVSDYAQLLHVTPGHLNDKVREQTSLTATTLIQERILLEAKRVLFHTELSVKEVGYSLGFEDAAYFNRFFKRLTGETPSLFREKSLGAL